MSEPLLCPEEKRTNIFPIRHDGIWERYKQALSCFWVPAEVDLSKDLEDWLRLTDDERHFVSNVLGFFAGADGIVCENLAERFGREVTILEAKFFYDFQKTMENLHNEMYSLLIQTLIGDATERQKLFRAAETIPCVHRKAQWAYKYIESDASFATRLVAFAVVEGVFFSGSFCAIFWLKKRGLMPGLCAANALIARDEGLHQSFATFLYKNYVHEKLSSDLMHEIVTEAVEIEMEFITESLPVGLLGMNAQEMGEYIKFVADRLVTELGEEKIYNAANPFAFMELLSLEGKTNFFEKRVTEYVKKGRGSDFSFDLHSEF
jgi:ribonucleoside-diphosphate reductase beta chain